MTPMTFSPPYRKPAKTGILRALPQAFRLASSPVRFPFSLSQAQNRVKIQVGQQGAPTVAVISAEA
jgi:hypothetical protein